MIEHLESRIAPAAVFPSGKGFTYTDKDGDFVTVSFSKAILQDPGIRDAVVAFAAGPNWGQNVQPEELLELDLVNVGDFDKLHGLDVTVSAKQQGHGDGYVHMVGLIAQLDALGVGQVSGDLGKVKIDGWLDGFRIGDADQSSKALALKSLEVQGLGGQHEGVTADIFGSVGSIIVHGNVTADVFIFPPAGFTANDVQVGKIWIGGSLTAGAFGAGGRLQISASITGSIYIGGNVAGGTADLSGQIASVQGNIKSLTVHGSLIGGQGADSGRILVVASKATIGGSVIGGGGDDSGFLATVGASASIGGSVIGGDGARSGVASGLGTKGSSFSVGGDVVTTHNPNAGYVQFTPAGNAGKITIGGSLINRVDSVFSAAGAVTRAGGSIHLITSSASGSVDSITVGGTLRGGNIVGNVLAGIDGYFGTGDDVKEVGGASITIGKIVVKGGVEQVVTPGSFGIAANALGSVQLGKLTLTHAMPGVNFGAGIAIGDFFNIREV